jgi:hypothetical protein
MAFKLADTFEIDVSQLAVKQALDLFFEKGYQIPWII